MLAGLGLRRGLAAGADAFGEIEKECGGRLGVAYLDTGTGRRGGFRSDERFPMCSTFKLLLAGAVLRRVDEGKERLDRVVRFSKGDLLSYAPVSSARVETGMTVRELCDAAVTLSDNTAANVLLGSVGGPAGVTAYVRTLGDSKTRLDRTEPDLNESKAGDPRDTTTPRAMVEDVQRLALGSGLSAGSKEVLTRWLVGCKTGDNRIRAAVPPGWRVGDKTGTGPKGTAGDVAVIWPVGRAPVVMTVYVTGANVETPKLEEAIAAAGRVALAAMR